MTEEHRRAQIAAETKKGDDALREAEALMQIGLFNGAATRFYYAVFHYATAALLSEDVVAKSHHGIQVLFSKYFMRSGRLPTCLEKDLKRLQGLREAADYNSFFSFDRAGVEEEAAVAKRFVEQVRALLVSGGWL